MWAKMDLRTHFNLDLRGAQNRHQREFSGQQLPLRRRPDHKKFGRGNQIWKRRDQNKLQSLWFNFRLLTKLEILDWSGGGSIIILNYIRWKFSGGSPSKHKNCWSLVGRKSAKRPRRSRSEEDVVASITIYVGQCRIADAELRKENWWRQQRSNLRPCKRGGCASGASDVMRTWVRLSAERAGRTEGQPRKRLGRFEVEDVVSPMNDE